MDERDMLAAPALLSVVPILPVRNMERSIAFYQRLGFLCEPYRDGLGSYSFLTMNGHSIHLNRVDMAEFFLNPCGVYLYMDEIDVYFAKLTAAGVSTLHRPENKPWRMREFAVSDPDETLLRFGQRMG